MHNSLSILVFGLANEHCKEWDISWEYADIAVSYELAVKESFLQPESFNPAPADGIYKLAVKKK